MEPCLRNKILAYLCHQQDGSNFHIAPGELPMFKKNNFQNKSIATRVKQKRLRIIIRNEMYSAGAKFGDKLENDTFGN